MATIKFKKPINFDGKTYESIEIDEPTLGAMEAFEKAQKDGAGEIGATITMLAADSGMPEGAVRKIVASDLLEIQEALAPFLEGLKGKEGGDTGGKSPPIAPTS